MVWRGVSRLDAFSGYPVRAWLPSDATGVTTGAPEARPSRSSRTGAGAAQASCARGGRATWCTRGAPVPVLSYWGRRLASLLHPRQIGTELSHDVLNPAHVPL